jgi:tRNA A-37 threonylcarbamoyl transferase component Bud32
LKVSFGYNADEYKNIENTLIKYTLNPKYTLEFQDFLLQIKEHFSSGTQTIHKARNELKVLEHKGYKVVVKAFKVPNPFNKFVYAYIRAGKAKKSYENGMRLMACGVATPEPIGFIEFYKNGVLHESFFVSMQYDYDFVIREPLYDKNFKERETILQQFVSFTFLLHQKNVFHKDYSAGNILVANKGDGRYDFSIVDINRMQFRTIDIKKAMENFNKLWADEETLIFMGREYARISGYDEEECVQLILLYDRKLKQFVQRRRAFKALLIGKKCWLQK